MYEPDNLKLLLDRVRLGTIVGPEHLDGDPASPDEPPALDGRAIAFPAPERVVQAFTPGTSPMSHRFSVHPRRDWRDNVVVMTLQCAGLQLYCVLPMSDAGVQAFLGDCMERSALQLLLLHEDGERYSVLRVATHFRESKRLRSLMRHARPYGEGIKALAGLTLELADTRPVPSLVEGQQVNDALVVLAGDEVGQAMEAAFGSRANVDRR